ncbi:MAG: type II secretion system protein [Candidatus Izemoplasmatales bacterium]|nr:type II secretion system protein [Candidatus Izemoplasmatales bacterium]
MSSGKNKNRGTTLVELVVSLSLSAILFVILATISVSIRANYLALKEKNNMNQESAEILTLIKNIIDSYNAEGVTLLETNGAIYASTLSEEPILRIDVEERALYYVYYEDIIDETPTRSYPYRFQTALSFHQTDKILRFTLTDISFSQRQLFFRIVGEAA